MVVGGLILIAYEPVFSQMANPSLYIGAWAAEKFEFVALSRVGPLLFFVRHAALQPTDFHLEIGLSRAHDGQSTAFLCLSRLMHLHRTHPAQIFSAMHTSLNSALAFSSPPHAELTKPQNTLEPAIGRLCNPFALSVGCPLHCLVSNLAAIAAV